MKNELINTPPAAGKLHKGQAVKGRSNSALRIYRLISALRTRSHTRDENNPQSPSTKSRTALRTPTIKSTSGFKATAATATTIVADNVRGAQGKPCGYQ